MFTGKKKLFFNAALLKDKESTHNLELSFFVHFNSLWDQSILVCLSLRDVYVSVILCVYLIKTVPKFIRWGMGGTQIH